MNNVLATLLVLAAACGGKDSTPGSGSGSAAPAPTSAYLTVAAYCDGFCSKLCGTCGSPGMCDQPCHKRCYFGRTGDKLLDGSDPKTGLALTQHNLDACVATITAQSCVTIASGQVPPACYTIQH